jgi:hypothetical protein
LIEYKKGIQKSYFPKTLSNSLLTSVDEISEIPSTSWRLLVSYNETGNSAESLSSKQEENPSPMTKMGKNTIISSPQCINPYEIVMVMLQYTGLGGCSHEVKILAI